MPTLSVRKTQPKLCPWMRAPHANSSSTSLDTGSFPELRILVHPAATCHCPGSITGNRLARHLAHRLDHILQASHGVLVARHRTLLDEVHGVLDLGDDVEGTDLGLLVHAVVPLVEVIPHILILVLHARGDVALPRTLPLVLVHLHDLLLVRLQ